MPSTPRKVPSGHGPKSRVLYLHASIVRTLYTVRLSGYPSSWTPSPGVEARCTGSITLEVVFGSPDNFWSEELIFDIVPYRSGYHTLLGRTAFARFNAVPHYAYLKLKMPGPRGVITVNGNMDCSLRTEEHTAALAAEVQSGFPRQTTNR